MSLVGTYGSRVVGYFPVPGGGSIPAWNLTNSPGNPWDDVLALFDGIFGVIASSQIAKLSISGGLGVGYAPAPASGAIINGFVGIGAVPACSLDVAGTVRATNQTVPTSGAGVEIIYSLGQGYLVAYDRTGAAYHQMNIDGSVLALNSVSGGKVGIGTASPSHLLHLSADDAAKPSTSTWTVASDSRLKRNIHDVTDDSVATLSRLRWISAEYNGLAGIPAGTPLIGLVAQEAQAVMPNAVRSVNAKLKHTDEETTALLGVDYHHVLVHSARAIAQLARRVSALEQKGTS